MKTDASDILARTLMVNHKVSMTDNTVKMLSFLESHSGEMIPGAPAIVGFPLDVTATYRLGTGNGPEAIRKASDSIESYSPALDRDLTDAPFSDVGDVELRAESLEACLNLIRERVFDLIEKGCAPVCLGGEHTITLPIVSAMCAFHPDLVIVHADAHSDLREEYEGSRLNHATVMRRIVEIVGPERLIQLGIRAGTREEFTWMRSQGTLISWEPSARDRFLDRIGNHPVYLTFDLDVLDPSCLPGTGNPEPGGWTYADARQLLKLLERVHLVGADVVELNPGVDQSEVSAVTAATIVRELVATMAAGKRGR